jgi:aminoglycoside 6'-N-acetyltransferase
VKGTSCPVKASPGRAGPRVVLRRFHPGGAAGFAGCRSSVPAARFEGLGRAVPAGGGRAVCPGAGDRASRYARGMVRVRGGAAPGRAAGRRRRGHAAGRRLSPGRDGGHDRRGYRGHGYAAGAVRLLPGCLFTARGRHRVTACCDPREAAPAALPERPGMRREGHLRQSTRAEGGWTGDLVYALLHEEWQSG